MKKQKYKPKLRLKKKKEIVKKTFYFIIIFISFSLLFLTKDYLKNKFYNFSKKIKHSEIVSVDVNFKDKTIENNIKEYSKNLIGFQYNKKEKEIKNYINNNFPLISNLKLNYKSFNGNLAISGEIEKPLLLLKEGNEKENKYYYLTNSGNIVYLPKIEGDFLNINLIGNSKVLPENFISFLKEFVSLNKNLNFEILNLEYLVKNNEFMIKLSDNSQILWGDFDFTNEKINKLNLILQDALNKIKPPLKINLIFFKEGKILVSKI